MKIGRCVNRFARTVPFEQGKHEKNSTGRQNGHSAFQVDAAQVETAIGLSGVIFIHTRTAKGHLNCPEMAFVRNKLIHSISCSTAGHGIAFDTCFHERDSIAMRFRITVAGLLALIALPAFAADAIPEGVYSGTLGKREVVLEIGSVKDEAGNQYDGRYFYKRYGVAIPLKITREADGSLRLQEMQGERPTGAEWRLAITADGAKGEFCRCDIRKPASSTRKRTAISLALLPGTTIDSREKTYRAALLDYPLASGSEIRIDDQIGYVLEKDRRYGAALPRLTHFPDPAVMQKVNDDLAHALDDLRLEAAECLFSAQHLYPTFWDQEYRVALLNRDVLSIGGSVSHQCKKSEAHPVDEVRSLVYDLHTGERFNFDAFFQSADQIPDELVRLYRTYHKASGFPEGCAAVVNDSDFHPDVRDRFYFDRTGLALDLSDQVAPVNEGCATEVIIPYREIDPLVRTDRHYPWVTSP